MTADDFRRMALSFPESTESAHLDHPDFRVRGKVFATLGYPDEGWGMVKLPPDQQSLFVRSEPKVYVPVKGTWGKQGATSVRLDTVTEESLRGAMLMAWRRAAPKRLAALFEHEL
jgi:hypothetical protein